MISYQRDFFLLDHRFENIFPFILLFEFHYFVFLCLTATQSYWVKVYDPMDWLGLKEEKKKGGMRFTFIQQVKKSGTIRFDFKLE